MIKGYSTSKVASTFKKKKKPVPPGAKVKKVKKVK